MKKAALLQLFLLCVGFTYAQAENQHLDRRKKSLAECHVVVSPNPSYGTIFVNAPEGSRCIVSSSKGTYIGTWNIEKDGFRMEGLSTGTYVVIIKHNNQTETRKFIVL